MPVPTAVAPSGTESSSERARRERVGRAPERVRLAPVRVRDAQRHRVLQAGAPEVLGLAGLHGLREQRLLEQLDALERLAADDVRRERERGRVHVVRRLRAVDVIVRVHAVVRPARAAQQLVGAVRDDLVHVHVDRRAAAAVHDVDRELAAVARPLPPRARPRRWPRRARPSARPPRGSRAPQRP